MREGPIAPGSGDPTSDIDRSASSTYLRRYLRAAYMMRVAWRTAI